MAAAESRRVSAPQFDLARTAGIEALKSAPPLVVTAVAYVTKGLPIAISLLSLIYLFAQLTYLLWRWRCQAADRREIATMLGGRVAEYKPRMPK